MKTPVRLTVVFVLTILSAVWGQGSAWALGPASPPIITFAAVWTQTSTTDHEPGAVNGVPQLLADLSTLIPGGFVPADVQSVTVLVPGEGSPRTLFKDADDLFLDEEYFLNLTRAGVAGFPPGTYMFTVTDRLGGVSMTTDTLTAVSPLPGATGVAISGASAVSADAFRAGFKLRSTPTISWTPAPGAVAQVVRVRQFSGPTLFSHFIADGLTNSQALPGGIFIRGRLYQVAIDAYDDVNSLPTANTQGRRTVQLFVDGPEILLNGIGGTANGQTLRITADILNTGGQVTVDVEAWVGLPTGQVTTVLDLPGLTIPTATPTSATTSSFFSGTVFKHTFIASDPAGAFVFRISLRDPRTNETIVEQTLTFTR